MSCFAKSFLVTRVSSHKIKSASRSIRKALNVISSKLPMGVATINKFGILVHHLVFALLDVHAPLFKNFHKNFKRRFNDEIQNKNEDVDLRKGFGQPLAGADDGNVKKVGEKRKHVFAVLNHRIRPGETAQADAKERNERQEQQKYQDADDGKLQIHQAPNNQPEGDEKGDRVQKAKDNVGRGRARGRVAQLHGFIVERLVENDFFHARLDFGGIFSARHAREE